MLVVALVSCLADCGGNPPTSPTSSAGVPPAVAGVWAGSYGVNCPGSPTCGIIGGPPPSGAQPLSLVLNQTGNALSGQINLSGWLSRVADVIGATAPDGTVALQGGSTWPSDTFGCQPAGGWHLASWNTRHDARSDTMTGGFSFVTQKHLSSCIYDQNLTVNGTSLSLARGTISNAPFQGHWQGTYIIRTCTPVRWTICYPQLAGEFPFDLTLTQSGTMVSGALAWFSGTTPSGLPVTGTVGADGLTLTLTGSLTLPQSGAVEVLRITAWSTARDTIGRMQGGFSFIYEFTSTTGPNQDSVSSSAYDADLRSVVLVPW